MVSESDIPLDEICTSRRSFWWWRVVVVVTDVDVAATENDRPILSDGCQTPERPDREM